MHQRKSKKFFLYLFLLILVGSIHNISLSNLKLKNVTYIKTQGLDDNNIELSKKLKNLNLANIFLIKSNQIINQIETNTLVESYSVFKQYPSSIFVNVDKTRFLAKIKNNEKIFIVGSNGKLIENDLLNNQLPFIFGNPNIDEFLELRKILKESEISYNEVDSLFFFSSGRWDIKFKNDIMIKLPRYNISETLKLVAKFLHSDQIKDIKIIDARIKNQIILND